MKCRCGDEAVCSCRDANNIPAQAHRRQQQLTLIPSSEDEQHASSELHVHSHLPSLQVQVHVLSPQVIVIVNVQHVVPFSVVLSFSLMSSSISSLVDILGQKNSAPVNRLQFDPHAHPGSAQHRIRSLVDIPNPARNSWSWLTACRFTE